jgi:hypothetical protein
MAEWLELSGASRLARSALIELAEKPDPRRRNARYFVINQLPWCFLTFGNGLHTGLGFYRVSRFLNSDPVGLSMTDTRWWILKPLSRGLQQPPRATPRPQSRKLPRANQLVVRGGVVWGPALWRCFGSQGKLMTTKLGNQAGKRLIPAGVFRVPAEPLLGRGRMNG